jgi:hypothetical protein
LSEALNKLGILESWETQFAGVKNQSLAAGVLEGIFERLHVA